jgi:ribosomal protein S18 acetylase RimI-like enzyme
MTATGLDVTIRTLRTEDLDAIVELDCVLTGERKPQYWAEVFERFLEDGRRIGLAADEEGRLEGYLFGELRAFEFGSEECGWVFALGVDPETTRKGVGSSLLTEACARFRALGVSAVRTMVLRNDVPFLSLFRGHGFVGGPFVQLELGLAQPGGEEVDS